MWNCSLYKNNSIVTNGIPYNSVENKPTVICHPAAGYNYITCWNIMKNIGNSFIIHFTNMEDINLEDDSIVKVRTKPPLTLYNDNTLKYNNRLVWEQIKEEGFNLPECDILYLDWLAGWIPELDDEFSPTFVDYAKLFVHRVRDGGLIFLDLKHYNGTYTDKKLSTKKWFRHSGGKVNISDKVMLEYIGRAVWPEVYIADTMNEIGVETEVKTDIFVVNNKSLSEVNYRSF